MYGERQRRSKLRALNNFNTIQCNTTWLVLSDNPQASRPDIQPTPTRVQDPQVICASPNIKFPQVDFRHCRLSNQDRGLKFVLSRLASVINAWSLSNGLQAVVSSPPVCRDCRLLPARLDRRPAPRSHHAVIAWGILYRYLFSC